LRLPFDKWSRVVGDFRMPMLGADMEAGTLVEWTKHPGDQVHRGDIIAVVDTQKGAIDIEVFEDGVLDQIVVQTGAKVPVGTVLAHISATGAPPASGPPPEPAPPVAAAPIAPPHRVEPPSAGRARVSPIARKLAANLGVDLARVSGTGAQGAITREDVERAGATAGQSATAHAAAPAIDRAAAMRAAIANAMAKSKREIPHYYLSTTIDLSAALVWLRSENEKRPVTDRLLPAVLLIKAVALALRDVPELNGTWVDGSFRRGSGIHIGCAISLRGGGLVAPALHDADRSALPALMRSFQDLVTRARAGALRSSELADPTITVTNLGDQGVESTFGIIYPPQVALVGFGRIASRPWVVGDRIEARPLVTATLSADHRATDGHRGGRFLTAVDKWLQTPEKL
jgi:pyruvate dehydrogenase E2 component (dihydrolipoyllysine-residue acetyltransferase)